MIRPYGPTANGICPHCGTYVQFLNSEFKDGMGSNFKFGEDFPNIDSMSFRDIVSKRERLIYTSQCPSCHKPIVSLSRVEVETGRRPIIRHIAFDRFIYPKTPFRKIPENIPNGIRKEFLEAIETMSISDKASAALSRRCLQSLLYEQGYQGHDLNSQIDKALPHLPNYISENLHAIRAIGNIGVHPTRSVESGEIIDVEPDEAGFLLQILEQLLEFYYVHKKKSEELRDRISTKLVSAGKPPLKSLKN